MEEKKKRIESKVAEAILQKPVEIEAGGKRYVVDHPSVATLIMASEAISRLPEIRADKEDIVRSSLAVAKDCRALGEIAAVLILGAREACKPVYLTSEHSVPVSRAFGLGKGTRTVSTRVRTTAARKLAGELLESMSPGELHRAVAAVLGRMEIADFFALTTFLSEINLLRPTKVAAGTTEATASGR